MKQESVNKKDISIFGIEEFSFGRKFGLLGRLFHSVLSKRLEYLGLKRHFSILVLVHKIGDNCSQKFIADTLHIDKTAMVGVLDDLVGMDFVKRTQNPSDRREYWIQLTEKGRKYIPEILETVNTLNNEVLAGLSPREVKQLHKYLGIIYKNIQTLPEPE
jgi:MarR family transcriptional regulator, transcriptional regulator for hemolysin